MGFGSFDLSRNWATRQSHRDRRFVSRGRDAVLGSVLSSSSSGFCLTLKKSGRSRSLIYIKDFGILTQSGVNQKHLLTGYFAALDNVRALLGGEKVVNPQKLKYLAANTVDTPNTLNDSGWVPRDIVVDDRPSPVQIDALGKFIAGEQDLKVIFLHCGSYTGIEIM
jgi:hypothetical protein